MRVALVALERSVRWSQLTAHLSRGDRVISVDHTRPNGNMLTYRPHHPMGRAVEDTSANPSKDARLRLLSMISEGGIGGT